MNGLVEIQNNDIPNAVRQLLRDVLQSGRVDAMLVHCAIRLVTR